MRVLREKSRISKVAGSCGLEADLHAVRREVNSAA
jgi:hypothetical protein